LPDDRRVIDGDRQPGSGSEIAALPYRWRVPSADLSAFSA
jgi:hypothetical protein